MKEYYDLDFENIKSRFKDFLKGKSEFSDYNFEGSAISSLLDMFSYAIMYQTFYLNMSVNELFLSTATMNESVHKIASMLNYKPKRKGAPNLKVLLQKAVGAATVTIPKYTKFLLDDIKLINMDEIVLADEEIHEVTLYQGEIVTELFDSTKVDGDASYESFTLTYKEEIDNDMFYVFVDRSDGAGGYVQDDIAWEQVRTSATTNSKKFYGDYFDVFKIRFDNGSLYNYPVSGDRVRVVYLKTDGPKYNGANGTLVVDKDSNEALYTTVNTTVTVALNGTLADGTSEDSINKIKNQAPMFHVAQNRAVTENDYNTLVKAWTLYETLYSSYIWGGEKEAIDTSGNIIEYVEGQDQKLDLGHVYVTAINSDFSYLDASKISSLISYFDDYKIMSIFLKFIHPNIVTINPSIKIRKKDIFGLVNNDIRLEVVEYLEQFKGSDKRFNKSNLLRAIDGIYGVDYSDVTFDLTVQVYHEDYKIIRLNNPVVANSITGTINGFVLADDGSNNLVFDDNGTPVTVGSINYDTGFIILDFATNPCVNFIPTDNIYELSFDFQNQYSMAFQRETLLGYNEDFVIEFDTI